MRICRWALAVLAMTALPLAARAADNGNDIPYNKLDNAKLLKALNELDMKELVEAHKRQAELAKEPAEVIVKRAAAIDDPDQRAALLHVAISRIDAQAAAMADKEADFDVLKRAQLRGLAINARASRVEPYAQKLMYLIGGDGDKQAILRYTADIEKLADLRDGFRTTLEDWRGDRIGHMAVLSQMEEAYRLAKYQIAWLEFYRAVAAPEPSKRADLLRDAMQGVSEFASSEDDIPVRRWAELLTAMCSRELGGALDNRKEAQSEYKSAADLLKGIIEAKDEETPGRCREQAMFELVRVWCDAGNFEQAVKDVEAYRAGASKHMDNKDALAAFRAALLQSAVYEAWSQSLAAADAEKSKEYGLKSMQLLVDYASKQDERVQTAFYAILADKYRHRTDYENLNSMLLWAIGRNETLKVAAKRKAGQKDEAASAKALATLEALSSRSDPVAAKYREDAGAFIGFLLLDSDKIKAARQFAAAARQQANTDEGLRTCQNAVAAYYMVVTERGRSGGAGEDIRAEFIAAMEMLLAHPKAAADPKTQEWLYELGQQCELAARANVGDAQLALLKKAADTYLKVPQGLPTYMEAQFRALASVQPVLLDKSPKDAKPKMAQDLVAALTAYADQAAAAMAKASEDDARFLRSWGSTADFRAVEILFEELGKTDDAMKRLEVLPAKWPGSSMLRDAAEFKIAKLVEKGRIAEGADNLDKFVKDYPQQGPVLTEFVVGKVRERIAEIRGLAADQAALAELEGLRKAYLEFARMLHDRAVAAKKPPQEMYKLQQWLAEALLENSMADEALAIFTEKLLPAVKARVDTENAAIDAQISQLKRELSSVGTDADRVKKKANEFEDLLASKGLDPKSAQAADLVRLAKQYLDKAGADPKDIEYRLKNLVAQLNDAYDKLGRFLRERVESDAAVPLGMARAYRIKGDFEKSAKLYRQVVQGFERVRSRFPRNYWESMVEYCECVAEGYAKDAKVMRDLRAYMTEIKRTSPNMSGFEARFAAALARAGGGEQAPASAPTTSPGT
jgi:hypothetical protein